MVIYPGNNQTSVYDFHVLVSHLASFWFCYLFHTCNFLINLLISHLRIANGVKTEKRRKGGSRRKKISEGSQNSKPG